MNRTTILIFIGFIFCVIEASAQRKDQQLIKPTSIDHSLKQMMNGPVPTLSTDQVIKHIGEEVYIFDTVTGVKQLSDSLRLLYIGGIYPNNNMIILLKGRKLDKELNEMHIGTSSNFSGAAFMYDGKPAIIVTNRYQLGQKIQL